MKVVFALLLIGAIGAYAYSEHRRAGQRSTRVENQMRPAIWACGCADADGSLRISAGKVTHVDAAGYFATDLDGSMGNSGSPVFDRDGHVIGLFSRATGEGRRNAFEYGFVQRIHVASALAMPGLELGVELA